MGMLPFKDSLWLTNSGLTSPQSARDIILACECDMAEMHRLLNNLPILKMASADQLAQDAVAAFKLAPPPTLLKKHGLHMMRYAITH